jgi:hypothetical protein
MITTTIKQIKDAVSEISDLAKYDCEQAHSREVALLKEVLRTIAQGAPDAQELAAEAIKACDAIDYERWFA